MHEMAVDVEQAGAVRLLVHQMVVPDLVVERARFHRVRTSVRVASAEAASAGMRR